MGYANLMGLGKVLERIPETIQADEDRQNAQAQQQREFDLKRRMAEASMQSEALNRAIQQHTISRFGQNDARDTVAEAQKFDPYGYMNAPGIQGIMGAANIPTTGKVPLNVELSRHAAESGIAKDDLLTNVLGKLMGGNMGGATSPQQPQLPQITGPQAQPATQSAPQPQAPALQATAGAPQVPSAPKNSYISPSTGKSNTVGQSYTPSGPNAVHTGSQGPIAPSQPAQRGDLSDPTTQLRMGLTLAGIDTSKFMPPPEAYTPFDRARDSALGAQSAKDEVPPMMMQRAQQFAMNAQQDYGDAIKQLEDLHPGIDREYLKMQVGTPSNQMKYNDLWSTLKMFGHKKQYDPITSFGLGEAGPYTKLMQSGYLGNVNGLMGLLPGTRALGISKALVDPHQPQLGYETPLQSYAKLRYMHDTGLQRILDEVLHPHASDVPQAAPTAQ